MVSGVKPVLMCICAPCANSPRLNSASASSTFFAFISIMLKSSSSKFSKTTPQLEVKQSEDKNYLKADWTRVFNIDFKVFIGYHLK